VFESGISKRDDVDRVMASGAGAILVGESLVKSSDPSGQLRELGS
jgi:indole-3-glycerol phosphate synthase